MRRAVLVAILALGARAQDEPQPAPPVAQPVVRHEVRLRSRTVLVGRLEPEEWKVVTAFGQLKVPVHEIRTVRFGRKADPQRLARVQKSIEDLGSANPERRNHARAELKEQGAFAAVDLKRMSKKHEDPEVKRICKELLDEMDLDPEEIIPDEDRIETTLFALAGTVGLDSFKVEVEELGAISVHRKDIVYIRAYKASRAVKTTVSGANVKRPGCRSAKGDNTVATRSVQLPTASAITTVACASAAASRADSNSSYLQQKQPPTISRTSLVTSRQSTVSTKDCP